MPSLTPPTLQAVSANGYVNTALPTLSWSPVEQRGVLRGVGG